MWQDGTTDLGLPPLCWCGGGFGVEDENVGTVEETS